LALSVQATISNQVVWGLNVIRVASFDGTADVTSVIHAPQGGIPEKVTLAIPRAGVPSSGSMTIPAAGNTPVVTFPQAGTGTVSAGAVTMHVHGYSADGSPKPPFDIDCSLDSGQTGVVATFTITPVTAPSGAPSSSAAQPPPSPSGAASHPATPSSGSAPGSMASGITGPTSRTNAASGASSSSAEAGAAPSTPDTGANGSTAATDSDPVLAAAVHASTADASDSSHADKGAAVTDWLLVACALLVVGSAGLFAASRLKKRRERTAQP
jgi:hypothetical protein